MSMIRPDHMYSVIVTNAEDPKQPMQSITHNGKRIEIRCGMLVTLPGTHVALVQDCGMVLPITEDEYVNGQKFTKQKGERFVPRFNVNIKEDLTARAKMDMPPVMGGGIIIDPANPMTIGATGNTPVSEEEPQPEVVEGKQDQRRRK